MLIPTSKPEDVPRMLGDEDQAVTDLKRAASEPEDPQDSQPPEVPPDEEEPSKAVDHIITEEDLGRRLGDLAQELDTQVPVTLTEDQERMLNEMLFTQGWTSKSYAITSKFSVVFRTFSSAVSEWRFRGMHKIVGEDSEGEVSQEVSQAEYMLENNLHSIAISLSGYGDDSTCENMDFESEEACVARLEFVRSIPAGVVDRLGVLLNSFNDENRQLLSGKSLANF